MNLKILESARRDLLEGYHFYVNQQAGLGNYFLASLFVEIESLKESAGIHPIRFGSHRALSSKFPYAIYYRINGEDVVIRAVLDCRRNPRSLENRLKRAG